MKKVIMVLSFLVIAAGIVGVGVWYNQKMAVEQGAATAAAGNAAVEQQSQLMQQLGIKDLVVGTGTVARAGDTVNVLYTGTLDNGTVFDASSLHGNQPFPFTIGEGQVIEGWDLGVPGMKVGGTRELTIPPQLGYGAAGSPPTIPANATLHFKIQLLSISTST